MALCPVYALDPPNAGSAETAAVPPTGVARDRTPSTPPHAEHVTARDHQPPPPTTDARHRPPPAEDIFGMP
jgi:hypothetical protein